MEGNRNVWVDYLRSSLTVLVVAHHSTLAYTTFARFDAEAYIRSTHPIVDTQRWIGLDIFQNFNDIFFMSLMFLIGGLFLSRSIAKKGSVKFLIDRLCRLFVPFLLLGTLFMLVAYFPAYFVARNDANIVAYVKDFFTTQQWPVGPPWFIWVLFLFNLLFVIINPIIQKLQPGISLIMNAFQRKPLLLFITLLLITWISYVPIAYRIGAGTWTGWGPFDFQLSRIVLYFGYFILGAVIGSTDFNHGIFSKSSAITRHWWIWLLLCLAVYTILTISTTTLAQMVETNTMGEFYAWMIYYTLYISSCVLSCLAFIATFRRFANIDRKWWTSLSANAYLVYLIHYIFVTWIQFVLLNYNIPALFKFLIVFALALSLSWATSSLLRRVRLIRNYL